MHGCPRMGIDICYKDSLIIGNPNGHNVKERLRDFKPMLGRYLNDLWNRSHYNNSYHCEIEGTRCNNESDSRKHLKNIGLRVLKDTSE